MRDTLDSMPDSPEVTVVIPTRDRRSLLLRTLRSALAQEGVTLEIVVVDDGSADDTPGAVEALGDERIHLVRHERPHGVAGARNAGIAAASGEWVAFLDDDDLWAPHKLRTQLAVAAERRADFTYTGAVFVTADLEPLLEREAPAVAQLRERIPLANPVAAGGSSVVVRAELARALGGFDEQFEQLSDWDMWWRLAEAGTPAPCPETLVAYVYHSGSMLLSDPRGVVREREYLDAKHGLGPEQLRDPERVWFWRWAAEGAARAGRRRQAALLFMRGGIAHRSGLDLRLAAATLLRGAPERSGDGGRSKPATPDWLAPYKGGPA
jgi:glycosyltransferase involved in cell wall biosynthesis